MTIDPEVLRGVMDEIPPFNEYMLETFPRLSVEGIPDFIMQVYKESIAILMPNQIVAKGYRKLTPQERVQNEVRRKDYGINIATSNLDLYEFLFEDVETGQHHGIYLYLPYMVNNLLYIDGRHYSIPKTITETVFGRTADSISIRVIRAPLKFSRPTTFRLESAVGTMRMKNEFVQSAHIHMKKKKDPNLYMTIINYLFAKFGFLGTLRRFNLDTDDIAFSTVIESDTEVYEYYVAKNRKGHNKDPLYLKVRHELLEETLYRKLVANLLYTLTLFTFHTVDDMYDDTGTIFRVMMGKLISGVSTKDAQALNDANSHIVSLDTYLDSITKRRMWRFGIKVDDIYDLLQYIFVELDAIIVNTVPQNLYNKRIDALENILIDIFVVDIFKQVYQLEKSNKPLSVEHVIKKISIKPRKIEEICGHLTEIPDHYNDCRLVACDLIKIRQSGLGKKGAKSSGPGAKSPESRFHPSIPVVETMTAFSGSNPTINGVINPYVKITENGAVVKPTWAVEIDELAKYLPYK